MRILVTGGAGYIGSHTIVELLNQGYEVILVDNLSNSQASVVRDMEALTNKEITSYFIDILDGQALRVVFENHTIDAVIHFAGLKAVDESIQKPLAYYQNNVTGTSNILHIMDEFDVHTFIFSSSAAVYGKPDTLPVTEQATLSPCNPYGRTKAMCESMLADLRQTDLQWKIAALRYFNPVGAHSSGKLGERQTGTPANLMPYVTKVAAQKQDVLSIYGNNYPTKDGTGIRDYIHVQDLAKGHIAALEQIRDMPGFDIYNLGTGQGYSVMDIVQTMEHLTGNTIPYTLKNRRPGDVAEIYADTQKAYEKLGWQAEKGLHEMCRDAWNWENAQEHAASTFY